MRTGELSECLKETGTYSFQGDPEDLIRGVQLGSTRSRFRFQYMMLVDDTWGGSLADRLRVDHQSLPDRVERALESGVTGFICSTEMASHPALEGANVFSGPDSKNLFYAIAAILRDSRGRSRITAVTGSSGKTTTKLMIAHALRAAIRKGRVRASPQSFNVSTEVAKHLSRSPLSTHSVIEVAGSAFKAFADHGSSVSPDVAVVTSIAEAHLEDFGTLDNVAHTKAHIFDCPPPGGTAVINIDTPHSDILVRHATRQGCQVVTYGESADAGLQLLDYESSTGEVVARVAGEQVKYTVGARGKHMALNSLAVIAALRSLRTPAWWAGVESLASFEAAKGRGRRHDIDLVSGGRATLVDESYNANPGSMRVAIDSVASEATAPDGRRVLVLGDMLEMGDTSAALHANLANTVVGVRDAVVHLFGDQMLHLQGQLDRQGVASSHWDDLDALAEAVTVDLRGGDIVLVKSSNGTGLSSVVRNLRGEA